MSIKVLLADDHRLLREGLRSLLEHESGIDVVGEAGNGREALTMVEEHTPDVLVIDISMPELNGIDATRQILSRHPQLRVIALSMHSDRRYVTGMLEAGASGYVLKDCAGDEIVRAVRTVHLGKKFLSPDVTGLVVEDYVTGRSDLEGPIHRELGAREREVLQLLAEGKSSPQIAALLFLSTSTVEAHRRNIMRKLDIHSVAELTKYAIRNGLTQA